MSDEASETSFKIHMYIFDYLLGHSEGIIAIITSCTLVPLAFSYESKADRCLMIIYAMAISYMTSAAPVFATTMVPIFAFPFLGILPTKETYQLYFKDTFVMFSGYYAAAVEHSELHIRAKYAILTLFGCSPRRVHFAMCVVIMFFSMWVTNTACASMMVRIVESILLTLKRVRSRSDYPEDEDFQERRQLRACFYLTAAYAASIGGCGCVIGSPTNFVVNSVYGQYFPTSPEIYHFGSYMWYSIPIVIVCTFLMWVDLEIVFMGLFRPDSEDAKAVTFDQDTIDSGWKLISDEYKALGPITTHQISVIVLFVILVFAYITSHSAHLIGWADLIAEDFDPMNTVPEVCVVFLLFVLPVKYSFLNFRVPQNEPVPSLLTWEFASKRIPWNLIFLVGSGTALATGTKLTGLDIQIAKKIEGIKKFPNSIALLFLITGVVLATNITANITTANLTMPILARTADTMKVHPLYVIMPTSLACSMAFMLPGATPSNLHVRELGNISRTTMFIGGILPTITSILAIWIINSITCDLIYPVINDADEIRKIYNDSTTVRFLS